MKFYGIRVIGPAIGFQYRRKIRAATEPIVGGQEQPCVHVHGRYVGILHMGNQGNAGGPEMRISIGKK